jgi:hypothetical protein
LGPGSLDALHAHQAAAAAAVAAAAGLPVDPSLALHLRALQAGNPAAAASLLGHLLPQPASHMLPGAAMLAHSTAPLAMLGAALPPGLGLAAPTPLPPPPVSLPFASALPPGQLQLAAARGVRRGRAGNPLPPASAPAPQQARERSPLAAGQQADAAAGGGGGREGSAAPREGPAPGRLAPAPDVRRSREPGSPPVALEACLGVLGADLSPEMQARIKKRVRGPCWPSPPDCWASAPPVP